MGPPGDPRRLISQYFAVSRPTSQQIPSGFWCRKFVWWVRQHGVQGPVNPNNRWGPDDGPTRHNDRIAQRLRRARRWRRIGPCPGRPAPDDPVVFAEFFDAAMAEQMEEHDLAGGPFVFGYLNRALKYTSTSPVSPPASRSGTRMRKRCGPSMPECMPMGSERTTGTSPPGSMVVAPTTGWAGQQPSRTSMDGLPTLMEPVPVLRSSH